MFDFQRYTRFLPKLIFESSRSPSKVWVLAQSQSTMLGRITHMTMLSVVICVMSVWNQTSQAFVTCSCPKSDWLSKFVDRPQNVWSSNLCHVQACQDNLWANLWQFSTDSSSSCLNAWIDDRPNKDAKLCIVAPFFLFANSQYRSTYFRTCHSMSWDHDEVFAQGLSHPGNFSVAPAEIPDSNIFVNCFNNCFIRFAFTLNASQVHVGKKCAKVVLGKGAKILISESAQGTCLPHHGRRSWRPQQEEEGRIAESQNNHIMSAWRWDGVKCELHAKLEPMSMWHQYVCLQVRENVTCEVCCSHTTSVALPSAVNDLDYNKKNLVEVSA